MVADRDLTPNDAVVALRSFPRRFRSLFAATDDDRFDPDEMARRPGSDGVTAAEHLSTAIAIAQTASTAVRRRSTAPLPESATDDGRPLRTLLDRLDATATDAANHVGAVPNDDWATDELLEFVQDAVGAIAERLRAAQTVIDDVR